MQNCFGLLETDVMPIFMIIALDIVITLLFAINFSTLICSPTVLFSFKREASSENYGPRVYFYHIIFRYIKPKNQKYYFTVYLSLSDLTFENNREGIDNPFITLGHWYASVLNKRFLTLSTTTFGTVAK